MDAFLVYYFGDIWRLMKDKIDLYAFHCSQKSVMVLQDVAVNRKVLRWWRMDELIL